MMKLLGSFYIALLGASAVLATDEGSGPFPAAYYSEPDFQKHTVYRPINPPTDQKLQVFLWGEGGCQADGLQESSMMTEIASYGFVVLASGAPNGSGTSTSALMLESLDWIATKAGTTGPYANVDASKVAVAGFSCGGLEAYDVLGDPRIDILGIFHSGFLGNNSQKASAIKKPAFYFLGGETDIAYTNGLADYGNITAGIPKWFGSQNVGHGGTLNRIHGGSFGAAAVLWLQWGLKGNETAAEFFTEGGAEVAGWLKVKSANLDKFLSYAQ